MDKFISKREIEQYIENNGAFYAEAKRLLESFGVLTQSKKESDIYFTDKRNATLFVVSKYGDNSIFIKQHFDAPLISLSDLYNELPLPIERIIFFTQWLSGTYAFVYKIMKIFYEDDSRAFQIPIYELINKGMKYESNHEGFVTHHAITDIEMTIDEKACELLIEIKMDKYGKGRLQRVQITTNYRVSLKTLEIIESNITSELYSLK